MSAKVEGYTVSFQCSQCGRVEYHTQPINSVLAHPMSQVNISYYDLLKMAEELDFLENEDRDLICYDCMSRNNARTSTPSIAEHNPSLARR